MHKTWWNEVRKEVRAAIIFVIVAAVGTPLGFMIRNVLRIPDLERAATKQGQDIAFLKASMVTLMQQTGHPATKADLEKLMSSVTEFGAGAAKMANRATVVRTTTINSTAPISAVLAFYDWVPTTAQVKLGSAYYAALPTASPHVITNLVTSTLVTRDSGRWLFDGESLLGDFSSVKIVVTPSTHADRQYYATWANDANALRVALSRIAATQDTGKRGPRP